MAADTEWDDLARLAASGLDDPDESDELGEEGSDGDTPLAVDDDDGDDPLAARADGDADAVPAVDCPPGIGIKVEGDAPLASAPPLSGAADFAAGDGDGDDGAVAECPTDDVVAAAAAADDDPSPLSGREGAIPPKWEGATAEPPFASGGPSA